MAGDFPTTSWLRRHWWNMKNRCEDPKNTFFHRYDGRGIAVCAEWQRFGAFFAWAITNGWRRGLTIDRIDNDKGYSPENCRWVTNRENARNRSFYNAKTVTVRGMSKSYSAWAKHLGLSRKAVTRRLQLGWTVEQAVTTPKQKPWGNP